MTTPRKHLYLIALVPPQTVLDDVLEFKNELKSQFGASHALKLLGHITLQMPFWMHENHRPTLMANLETFSKEQKSFPIFLNGFGSFSPRVIFIKINDHEAIIQLQDALQEALPESIFAHPDQRQTDIHPHLTIATRDLQENIFPQAWSEYRNKPYQAAFMAHDLTLFRHTGKKWITEVIFPLNS